MCMFEAVLSLISLVATALLVTLNFSAIHCLGVGRVGLGMHFEFLPFQ